MGGRPIDRTAPPRARPPQAPARPRRADPAAPAEFGGDLAVWAAWLYYEEGMTQGAVADRIGLSRASVVNLLHAARERGIVTIAVAATHLGTVELAQRLARVYDLKSCLVVPDDGGWVPEYERVGRAGARLLAEQLAPRDVLGVAWGRTVLALSNALPRRALPDVTVAQITGSAIGTYAFSPEFCTSNIANRLGARCVSLHAPGIVSRPEVKDTLMREPTLIEQFDVLRACNRVLFGAASVRASSMAVRSGYLKPEDAAPYAARGAVAVLAGRFVDALGRPVTGALDERMIGLTLEEITRVPERICVAGGPDKGTPIAGVLRGGYATVLVTDERTARELLRLAGVRGGKA